MGKISVLSAGVGGGSSGALNFGAGFNVNGNTVSFALDDPSNMLFDPGFEDTPDLAQWTQSIPASYSIDTSIFFQGLRSAKTTTNNAYLLSRPMHCDPGDQFLLSGYMRTSAGASVSNGDLVLRFVDAAGSQLLQAVNNVTGPVTSWIKNQVSATAPTNTVAVIAGVVTGSLTSGTWYFDNLSLRRIALGDNIAVGAIGTGNLAPGSLGSFSLYSNSVRAIGITNGLPTLPSPNYPKGAIIFNTFDGKLWRNSTGAAWDKSADPQDLIAGTIAVGVLYAGTIDAAQVNAGLFNGLGLILNKNGVTTTINNLLTGGTGRATGIYCQLNSNPNQSSSLDYYGLSLFNTSKRLTVEIVSDSFVGGGTAGGQITMGDQFGNPSLIFQCSNSSGTINMPGSNALIAMGGRGGGAPTQMSSTYLQINFVPVIDSSGVFIGAGADVGSHGIRCRGINPIDASFGQFFGRDKTVTISGVTLQFVGGIMVTP